MLHQLERTAALFGLFINTGKGKTEVLFAGPPCEDQRTILTLNGREVPSCKQYKYLGALLGTDWRTDLKRRTGLAWALLRRYNRTWTSSSCNDESKLHLFYALVVPTLTYSVCTYPWTQKVRDALNGSFNRMLRYAMNDPVDFNNLNRHTPIERLLGPRHMCLTATIVYNRLREHGHWVRQHVNLDYKNHVFHPLIDVLSWENQGIAFHAKRKQGPRDGLLSIIRRIEYTELCDDAITKIRWRRIVEQETLREQLSVASAMDARRKREKRRWLPSDSALLKRWAHDSAHYVFDKHSER